MGNDSLRSEGPVVNSPVRQGGVDLDGSFLSAEGAPRMVSILASGHRELRFPPPSRTGLLTTGPSDLEQERLKRNKYPIGVAVSPFIMLT
jgi:hypothetical protein